MVNQKSYGSDHYVHMLYIKKFKKEGYNFGDPVTSYYNEKNAVYPLFFHWFIAAFFFGTAEKNPNRINLFIFLMGYIFFNGFCFFYLENIAPIVYLKLNVVYSLFPFSYLFWNAKNRGLSPRSFGLLLGQVFTYFLIFFLETPSVIPFLGLSLVSFITLITSQFSNQFIILLCFLLSIIQGSFIYLLWPLFNIGMLYLLFPTLAKSFIKGQFYHKYNYAKYLAPVYILKLRPSIYRDFIYDFWVKLKNFKSEKINTLYYIVTNPLLELFYGFPFLWICFVWVLRNDSDALSSPLWNIILISLGIFFLTSFRITRFLGEPQRYVEFVIPLISIVFVQIVNDATFMTSVFVTFLFIAITQSVFYFFRKHGENKFYPIKDFLAKNITQEDIVISNDSNLIKYLLPTNRVLKTDLTRNYKNKQDFLIYNPKSFSIISVQGLLKFIKDYKADTLLLNKNLYTPKEIKLLNEKVSIIKIDSQEEYEIYKID